MRLFFLGLAALVVAVGFASPASAGPPGYPGCCYVPKPQAPDLFGPGTYCTHPCGMVYGPNHYVYPPFLPWNGVLPAPNRGGGGFPSHPYCRSPRDFFMYEDLGR